MKKYTGNIAKFLVVTGYSALVLSLSIGPSALADTKTNQASTSTRTDSAGDVAPTVSTPASSPNPAPTVSTPASSRNPAPTVSTPASSTNPAPTISTPASSTNNPLPTANPKASSSCSTTLDCHKTFVQLIEAVTDKPVPQEIQDLLQGVVSLERKGNDIELTKEDGTKVLVGGSTHFGVTVIGDFSDARDKVAAKFGTEIGTLIDEFVGVTANGSHLEVIRNGPEYEEIDLSEHKIKRQLPLKRVRLSKISLDVDVADAHPVLKNITGIEAVPNAGFEIPIVLKEFSRSKNQDGDDVFTFGVKNPLPLMKSFKRLFGIKEIMPLTWTVKKQDPKEVGLKEIVPKEIGAKEPAEHKE